jgi:hypothetical protein
VAAQIDALIMRDLPGVIAVEQPRDGYRDAMQFAEEMRELLTGPEEWIALGYLTPPPVGDELE